MGSITSPILKLTIYKYSQKAEHFGVFALLFRPTKKKTKNTNSNKQKEENPVAFPTNDTQKQTTKTKKHQPPQFVFLSRKMMPAFGAGCQQRRPTKPQTDSDRVTFEVFPRGVNCWETLEVDGKENTSLVGDLTNPFEK